MMGRPEFFAGRDETPLPGAFFQRGATVRTRFPRSGDSEECVASLPFVTGMIQRPEGANLGSRNVRN
jgi:hypothetical protein